MTAVLGWVGVPLPDHTDSQALIKRMSRDSMPEADTAISQGPNTLVAAHRYHGKLYSSKVGGWHVVVLGHTQCDDPTLNQQIQQYGLGQALVTQFTTRGSDFLATLSGHYLLVMVSDDESRALLAVDRFGMDPLSYARCGNGLVFASKALWVNRHPNVLSEVAPQSIFNYLYFHMIPSPNTLFAGVSKLEPGCCLELSPGGIEVKRYWKPVFSNERGSIPKQYGQEFLNRVRSGVERLVDDPATTGCFLSGGTDSSTIAGMLGQVTGEPAKTFSIGFASQGFDETEYSRIAAKHFSTNHHEYYVTPEDVVAAVPKIAAAYGEPFGNSSVVPTYYCAMLARDHGVQRLLGGDGGDELFGGNERYSKQLLFSLYDSIPRSVKHGLLEPVLLRNVCRQIPLIRKFSSYVEQAREAMPDRMETYNLLLNLGIDELMEKQFLSYIDQGHPLQQLQQVYRNVDADTMLNRMLATDFKFTLSDNDLPKVKLMCELAKVDVGFPFLDSHLLDLSLSLPVNEKIRRLRLRHFFKESLKGFLPEAILTKSKHGFGLPFGPWLLEHQGLRELAFDALSDFKSRGILSSAFLDKLMQQRLTEHAAYYGTLVWIVMMLEYWLSAHDVKI